MDLVCSSDDDIVNPEYKEDIKTEAKSVKKSVKKSLKKAVKANSVAKKAMGRPRATPTEIKDSVHILSDSIKSSGLHIDDESYWNDGQFSETVQTHVFCFFIKLTTRVCSV